MHEKFFVRISMCGRTRSVGLGPIGVKPLRPLGGYIHAVSRLDLSIGRFQIDNQTRLGTPVAIVCLHEGYESAVLHAQSG